MTAVGPRCATPGPTWRRGRRLLVVGVGSPLRRDDALGPAVAAALRAGRLPEGVAVRAAHGLTPELAVDLAEVDAVWFVDAAAAPGPERPTWTRLGGRGATPGTGPGGRGGHALDPSALLAWTEAWAGRAPEAWLLALPAADLSLGTGLSRRGARSLRAALRSLRGRWVGAVDRAA